MQEIEKPTKSAKAKKNIDWQAIVLESSTYVLQGALMTLGAAIVNKGVQTMPFARKPEQIENVVPFKKIMSN